MRPSLVALLFLGALATARAQDVLVEPREVEEGRPVTVSVAWTDSGIDPVGVWSIDVGASFAGHATSTTTLAGPRERSAFWLGSPGDEVLTLDLVARGEPGRRRRSMKGAALAGEPCFVLKQVVAGERVDCSFEVVPLDEAPEVQLTLRLLPIGADALPAEARVYVRSAYDVWSPPGMDDVTADSPIALQVQLTRWIPRGTDTGPSTEVLLRRAVADAITPIEVRRRARLTLRRAAFGYAAARAKVSSGPVTNAVRLGDDRWVLQQGDQVALVAAGALLPMMFRTDAFPWVIDLARHGRLALTWYDSHEYPAELTTALKDGGFGGTAQESGLMFELTTANLAPFLAIFSKHGAKMRSYRIRFR